MADHIESTPQPRGLYAGPSSQRVTTTERMAIGLCAIWLLAVVVFFAVMGGGAILAGETGLVLFMAGIATLMPLAVILMVAAAARSVRLVREESLRLQATVDNMHQTFKEESEARKVGLPPSVEKRLDELASSVRTAENATATFKTSRSKTAAAPLNPFAGDPEPDQPTLELGMDKKPSPDASMEDMIKALNFPDDANDKPGFAALRRALSDQRVNPTIQASQDILTLLSEDGIYMDDLRPDRARPDLWRRFVQGERGAMITALGGVRDRSSLALAAGRMRQDARFKQSTHQFLRHFDRLLQRVADDMTDAELAALTNTRTAKAFMLLGRLTGIFD